MAPRKHSFEVLCACVCVCVCVYSVCMCICVSSTCALSGQKSVTKVHKPTFWNLEIARARWPGHCAPRCHRETLAFWAKAAHMACWLS